jgi:uncharacterized protein with PhoU and TrkA domain
VFSRDVSMAEAVRLEEEKVATMFREIETAIRGQPAEVGPHILAVASSMNRIYDNSLDIADLVMPKLL